MSTAVIYLFIWLVVIVVFLYLLGTTALYLIGHSKRDNIQFNNFNYKIKFFNVRMHVFNEGLFILYEVMMSIFTLYILLTPKAEVRLYWINALIIIGLTVVTHLVWKILQGLDQDMLNFYKNYQIAQGALQKKVEAQKSIDNTKKYRKNIVSLIDDFEKEIRTVTSPEPYHLKDSVTIIDQFVSEQTKTMIQYEQDVVFRFNKTLAEFYEKGIKITIDLPKTNINFETQFNTVRSEIYNKYHKIFNDTLYDLISTRKFITAAYITKGLQILKDNEYSPSQKLIELILLSIDDIEGSPRELIDYITSKKIIELDELITYAINKKIIWVFKTDIFESQEQLSTISETLIRDDAYNLAIAFISNYFSRLKNVLAFIDKLTETNKTAKLFNNYRKVMDVDQTFYAEHKVLENKVHSLNQFFVGKSISPKVKQDLDIISQLSKAYENKDKINLMYEKVQERFDDLKSNAIQSLLMYSGISSDKSLFELQKTSTTINDFYNRLLINDLILASLLLYALFIKENTEEELHKDVIEILKHDERYMKILQPVDLDMGFNHKVQIANKIIRDVLLKHERARICNIILKVEKGRRTVDVLAQR